MLWPRDGTLVPEPHRARRGVSHSSHFPEEKTKAQEGGVTHSRSPCRKATALSPLMSGLPAEVLTSSSGTQALCEEGAMKHGGGRGVPGALSAPSHQASQGTRVWGVSGVAAGPPDAGHRAWGCSGGDGGCARRGTLSPVPWPQTPAARLGTEPVHPLPEGTLQPPSWLSYSPSPLLSSGIWEKGHGLPWASSGSRLGREVAGSPAAPTPSPAGCP